VRSKGRGCRARLRDNARLIKAPCEHYYKQKKSGILLRSDHYSTAGRAAQMGEGGERDQATKELCSPRFRRTSRRLEDLATIGASIERVNQVTSLGVRRIIGAVAERLPGSLENLK
jgi:hypothetical protein